MTNTLSKTEQFTNRKPTIRTCRAGNFSGSILHSLSFALVLCSLGMYELLDEQLLHPDEIQHRFKKVFGRDMTQIEREVFFLPVEPSSEQKDEG